MKDDKGLYYYPNAGNPRIRMYVRRQGMEIFFRMWSADDPAVWEKHGWAPYGAIREAAALYKQSRKGDPSAAYDIRVAEALIDEDTED